MKVSLNTERFSSRVANYLRYRPSYPPDAMDWITAACRLTAQHVVADIGSGTGLLTELFLRNGQRVYAVEPNAAMRAAAEALLIGYPGFVSVSATAEATSLPDAVADLVAAGQAFHWFDVEAARREFTRILKPGGAVALLWNDREADATPFLCVYDSLLRAYANDYAAVTHKQYGEDELQTWFGGSMQTARFENSQHFDWVGIQGRLLSSSYAPLPGEPNYQPLMTGLRAAFDAHQVNGQIVFLYTTTVYLGTLAVEPDA